MSNTSDRTSLLISVHEETCSIVDNKQFSRLAEKTQVYSPRNGLLEIPKNRETHSQEVALSSRIMALSIAINLNLDIDDIDYQMSVHNISLLHDIGQTAFGHVGADIINRYLINNNFEEGFCDNNNNLVVIEKNNIHVRDCVLAGLIKYPHKLYWHQRERYEDILSKAIDADVAHFKSLGIDFTIRPSRTMACEIMDEADRNSYTCSDLSDFFCNNKRASLVDIARFIDNGCHSSSSLSHFYDLLAAVEGGSKSDIKKYFSDVKRKLNMNYTINQNGLVPVHDELVLFRELINSISMEFYIKPLRTEMLHKANVKKLNAFIKHVFENDYYSSEYYLEQSKKADDENQIMRIKRDMIGEVSDWFVINAFDNLQLGNKRPEPSRSL